MGTENRIIIKANYYLIARAMVIIIHETLYGRLLLNRPFDDQSQDRIRIESEAILAILNKCLNEWTLVGSEAIDYEISKIPDDEKKRCKGSCNYFKR